MKVRSVNVSSNSYILSMESQALVTPLLKCSWLTYPYLGCLIAWDLQSRGERLRTVNLVDDEVSIENASGACAHNTKANHMMLVDSMIVCDFGRQIKTVPFPFATLTPDSSQHSKLA